MLRLRALASALLGLILILGFLTIMKGVHQKKKEGKSSAVRFEVKRKKERSQQRVRPKPKKKKLSQRKTLKPKLDLSLVSGGLDLGVDILGLSAQDSQLLSQSKDSVMTEDIVDELPVVQHRAPLPFPEKAKENNVNGFVTLNLLINKQGAVEQVKLVDAQPEGYFEEIALQGVQDWSFSPATYQGRFVSVWVKQKIKFQVN